MQRPDSGIRTDAGTFGPLPFMVGQVFSFDGRLTARDGAANTERSALYNLTVTLTAVEDGRETADSFLEYTVVGQNAVSRDWTDPYDFSSWVGRLGPTLMGDVVGGTTVRQNISQLPELPPRSNPKALPQGGFFVDLRGVTKLRAEFAQNRMNDMPRVVDPGNNGGQWLFEYTENDPQIFTYGVSTRAITMSFNEQGVLVRLTEGLSTMASPPYAVNELVAK